MPAGRPPIFESEDDLKSAIKGYFDSDDAHILVGENQDLKLFAPTVSGLAYHLGMTTETLRAYGEKEAFSATVKRAKQKIEISLEKRLMGNNVTGTIFNLKNNFGWKDKQEVDHGGQPDNPMQFQQIQFIPVGHESSDKD